MKRGWRSQHMAFFSVLLLLVVRCGLPLLSFLQSFWRTSPPPGFCDFPGDTRPAVTSFHLSVRSLVESQGAVFALVIPLDAPIRRQIASTRLYALYTSDGTLLWQQPIKSITNLLFKQDTLYLSSSDALEARRASGGTLLWQRSEGNTWYGPEAAPPVFDQGVLYVSERASIFAIRASDGQSLWFSAPELERTWSRPDVSFYSQPVVSPGQILVGTHTGTVVALRESSGTPCGRPLWTLTPCTYRSPSLRRAGTSM